MPNKYEEAFGSDWARILKPFIQSDSFKAIKAELSTAYGKGNVFPSADQIFRAFRTCPYGDMHTVFLTVNCYEEQNDGLAFSCKTAHFMDKFPKVLDTVLDAVEEDVCNGLYLNKESDLERWSDQGVLLLNCDLTVVKGSPRAHLKLWHPFIQHVIKFIGTYNTGINFVFIGNHAHNFARYVNKSANDIFLLEHPMAAVQQKRKWDHQNIFSKINQSCLAINGTTVDWTQTINIWERYGLN